MACTIVFVFLSAIGQQQAQLHFIILRYHFSETLRYLDNGTGDHSVATGLCTSDSSLDGSSHSRSTAGHHD